MLYFLDDILFQLERYYSENCFNLFFLFLNSKTLLSTPVWSTGTVFFSTERVSKPDELTIAEVKALFHAFFLDKSWKSERHQIEIKFRNKESVREFVERFPVVLRDNGIPYDSADTAHHGVKYILYFKVGTISCSRI